MKIIAVDDEHLALKSIARIINSVIPDCQLSVFLSPGMAISHAERNLVDVAFLDIETGGMTGLELAKRLKDICGQTNIVFVTGHSEYAVEAFSVQASGYILKPVTGEMILDAMDNLRNPVAKKGNRVRVQTFGNFDVFVDGTVLHFPRSKAKELFAYLIHKKGTSSTVRELAAILFEDKADSASLQNQVQTIISTMMKVLESAGAKDVIIKSFNNLAVDTAKVDCDYYRFLEWNAQAVNSYTGEYMTNYSWAEFTIKYLDKRIL